jgi:metallophosphoesterase (TIGR00282 family)
MRILFLGDIVGRPGRKAVKDHVQRLRRELELDLVFANGENASAGFGLSDKNVRELFASGVDGLTSGNHVWKFRNFWHTLDEDARLLRPHNYPPGAPGTGVRVFRPEGLPAVAVINLQGRTFMPPLDCPFEAAESILRGLDGVVVRIVDFHAEATGEKLAMGHFLDGRVSALVGTHTHVQTNDAVVLPGGTAYITDLGMCGPAGSCIGMKPEIILERYRTGLPAKLEVGPGRGVLHGAVFDIDDTTGRAVSIAPFRQE